MPSSRDLPDPGIEPTFLTSPALTGRFFAASATWEAQSFLVTAEQIQKGGKKEEREHYYTFFFFFFAVNFVIH